MSIKVMKPDKGFPCHSEQFALQQHLTSAAPYPALLLPAVRGWTLVMLGTR